MQITWPARKGREGSWVMNGDELRTAGLTWSLSYRCFPGFRHRSLPHLCLGFHLMQKKKLGNFSCNSSHHISSQKMNSQIVWEIIFFSLSNWERFGTQEHSSLLTDLRQVTQLVLRHSLPHKSTLRIATQKTATGSFSSKKVGSRHHNILRPYKELTMLLTCSALKTKQKVQMLLCFS